MSIFNDHLGDSTHESHQTSRPDEETVSHAGWFRLAVPCMALLITLGWFAYAIYRSTEGDGSLFQLASSQVQHEPAASFQTLWVLQLPEGSQNLPLNPGAAENSAGPAAIAGDAAVQAGWIKNLTAKLVNFGSWGSQRSMLSLDGSAAAPRAPTQLPQFVIASLISNGPPQIKMALATPAAGRSAKSPQESAEIAALQFLRIDFPANSAKIPSRSIPLVKRAAGLIRQLPAGTIVEVAGYTASTSNSVETAISLCGALSLFMRLWWMEGLARPC